MKVFILSVLLTLAISANCARPRWSLPGLPTTGEVPLSGNADQRITQGELAAPKQFPYQVGLLLNTPMGASWCGGTLLSNRWILTAAHCTDGVKNVVVFLGATDMQNEAEDGQKRFSVPRSNIIIHENWDWDTLRNDISLVKLPMAVVFNEYVQPATLPKANGSMKDFVGQTLVASGWGRDSDLADSVSQFLRYVEVPVMDQKECNEKFFGMVTDKMICIDTTGGRSTCNGDSGGPLVYRDGETNYVVGATSFGSSEGCEKEWPGVFTRVTSYLDWIEKHTGLTN